ncbi:NAD(P)-binding domain-containing protein [Streptomyces sp. B6B3]|uniref:NADPH-dependent F420 reductase n=1 Tax=Streptomyces sp. B6B3 TaxID=3153570 RepID=UPI00325EF4E9
MRIGILGTGNVGRAVGEGWRDAGHEVVWGSRTPGAERTVPVADAAGFGEVVVNATPGTASMELLRGVGGAALAGKVLVDIGIGFTDDMGLSHPGVSLGEEIQQAFPETAVVKTLCTMTAAVMRDPGLVAERSTVFLSGDDDAAKRTTRALLSDLGWPESSQLDLGGIATARGQEHFALLFLGVAGALGTHTFNIRVVPPTAGTATTASTATHE